jgi:hypothetical protein
MKKICFLYILTLFFTSCFEEQVPKGFFNNTTWRALESGGVYNDEQMLQFSYIDTHVLLLGETTFTHIVHRIEGVAGSSGYIDKGETTVEGTYTIKYPDITLKYEDGEKQGEISISTLTIYLDVNTHSSLLFKKISD